MLVRSHAEEDTSDSIGEQCVIGYLINSVNLPLATLFACVYHEGETRSLIVPGGSLAHTS